MQRRRFLASVVVGGVGLLAAGCTSWFDDDPPTPGSTRGPDAAVRAGTAASELTLLLAYSSTLAAHPQLAGRLADLRDHHQEHLRVIAPGIDPPALPVIPPGPTTTTEQAIRDLLAEEQAAGEQRISACDGAREAALARDLCSIAACEATHVAVLTAMLTELA